MNVAAFQFALPRDSLQMVGRQNSERCSTILGESQSWATEDLFEIKPVADGVYAAIAKPTHRVNSNAAIIFLGDSVLVVDANSTPSAARALIEQIKKLTPRPVKYVVNTHFHWDHTQGNEAYTNAWPAGV